MAKVTEERMKFLELRHNRILQGIAIKLAVLVGVGASISLLTTQLGLNQSSIINYNEILIIMIAGWIYVVYKTDSIKLIIMEKELGYSKMDRLRRRDAIMIAVIAICSAIMALAIFYLFIVSKLF